MLNDAFWLVLFRFDPKRRTITIGCSKFILRHSCFPNHFLVSSHDSIFVSLFSVLFKLSSLFAVVLCALYLLDYFFFFFVFISYHRIYLIPQRRTMCRPCFLGHAIPLSVLLVLYIYTSFLVRQNNGFHPGSPLTQRFTYNTVK